MPKSKSQSNSFWDHPIETLEQALSLRKKIEGLQRKLGKTLGNTSQALSQAVTGKKKKRMSPAARARISAAAKARWAKIKGSSTKAAKTATKATAKATKATRAPQARRKKG